MSMSHSTQDHPRHHSTADHRASIACLFLGLLWCSSGVAQTEPVCIPRSQGVPGLQGAPNWSVATAGSPVRTERDDPRWGPAPVRAFQSDTFGDLQGGYRILFDPAGKLAIALQMYADPGPTRDPNSDTEPVDFVSQYDFIVVGITGDDGATANAVRINFPDWSGPPPNDPVELQTVSATYVGYEYGAAGWTSDASPQPDPPGWAEATYAWIGRDNSWAVHLKVDLGALSIPPTASVNVALGIHGSDDDPNTTTAVDLTTPDVGVGGSIGDLTTMDPAAWERAGVLDAGCPGGISLSSLQIRSTNANAHYIDPRDGEVNEIDATPSAPAGMLSTAGAVQAKFRIANWGTIADPEAGWDDLPRNPPDAGLPTNGTGSAPNAQTIRHTCPANAGGQVCGQPRPSENHQCIMVELSKAPGIAAPVAFSRASAYRNFEFRHMSGFTDGAYVDVKGLRKKLGTQEPRTVYVHVKRSNMPAHGDTPITLPTEAMMAVRRMAEDPDFRPESEKQMRSLAAAFGWETRQLTGRSASSGVAMTYRPGGLILGSKAPSNAPSLQNRPWPLWGYSDHGLMTKVWPTYAVHAYYELGKRKDPDGREYMRLQPMVPFAYFMEHDGPLYGFTDSLTAAGFTEIRKDWYRGTIEDEGRAKMTIHVSAEEQPKSKGGRECPDCKTVVVTGCGRCAVGAARGAKPLTVLGIVAVLGLFFARRRRRR